LSLSSFIPRRRGLRIVRDDVFFFKANAVSHSLRRSSFPNRTRSAGLRFGDHGRRDHHSHRTVADFVSFATTFSFSKQTPSLIHSVAPPFRIEPAPLGFDSEITAVVIITHTAPSRTSIRSYGRRAEAP